MTDFNQLVTDLLEETWRHDPVGATHVGVHRYDHLLPDWSADAMEGWGQTLRDLRARFEAVDPTSLSRQEKLDRRWAIAVLDKAILDHDLALWARSPKAAVESLANGLHDLLIGQFAPKEERFEALLARLKAAPHFLENVRRLFRPETIPPIWIDYGLRTAQSTRRFIAEAIPEAAAEVPALEAEIVEASRAAAQAVADFEAVVKDLGGEARGDYAVGRERFDFILQRYHLLDMDSEALYEFGREWIDRYEREMVEVAARIDPNKSWVEVLEMVKDNHPSAEDLRQAYEDETRLARDYCLEHDLITFPEGETWSVEWMPAYLRSIYPIAKPWVSPPFDPGLDSKWYVTPVDPDAPPERQRQHLRDNSWAWIRGIAMHEMHPGHHLQFAIAKQVGTPLRKQFWSPLYGEGWGLYTEELFYETGLLADPPMRLMQLRNGLWRAVRVVIDTGLHTRGMSPEECARWLVERARLEPQWAESETRLYTTKATYVSTYRVGLSLIMDLREKYKALKGDAFTLKDFHDTLMSYSSLPLKLVEQEMLSDHES